MRRAILVRHAHAEWPAWTGRDFDRPLTPRGLADAASAAEAIAATGLRPTRWLVSPAQRTRQTAAALAAALGSPVAGIEFDPGLYNAAPTELEALLRTALETEPCVLLVAHNPGISELARALAGDASAPSFAPAHWRIIDVMAAGA